uniref:2S seed storage protein n=1 Tax=Camelina sativa TaxID=90675 RepID=J7I912_CAMSA|nr:2S seed storage protein 4-like precursor [Camelina sativa]AFQ32285.1 2S seed storage protein [Camelina sativa]
MANKLFLVCATLALCFLLTNASIYRTVVEFDEETTNPMGPRQRCQREFQQSQHLRACQELMRRQARQGGRGGDEYDWEEDMENPQRRQQVLEQCCNELRQEDPACVCPTLQQAARSVSIQGQGQGQQRQSQARQIYQTAKHLPNVCRIQQVDVCPFQIPSGPSYY